MATLDLLALPADGSSPGFDGMPLAPGVHLRWSFWPEFGWPAAGFELQRRHWYTGEFHVSPQSWASIASLNLPSTTDGGVTALRRARTAASGLVTSVFEPEVASLLRLVELVRPRAPAFVDAARGSTHVRIPALEVLLLAALDPYVARAIGLAYVDGKVAPTTPTDYRVIGHWGSGTCAWHETDLAALGPAELAGGPVDGNACRWWSDRARSLSPSTTPTAVQLDGVGLLTLRIQLAVPARELELELQAPTAEVAATRWRVSGRSGTVRLTTTSTPDLAVLRSGANLRIVAPADRLLDEVEIADTLTTFSSWRIAKLRHRRFIGAIGDQISPIVCVSRVAAAMVPEPHLDVPWPAPAVVTPAVAAVTSEETISHLDDDGRIRPRSWQLATRLALPVVPAAGQPELARPVRINTGYTRVAGSGGAARTEVSTMPMPRPGNLHTLVGRWRLDGTGAASGPSLLARGTVRFESVRSALSGVLDMQCRTAYLTGAAGSGETGPGYLEASAVPGLDGAGTDLHIQLWVMPLDDPESYPTLVGNDYRQSFWLGLTKLGTSYRPRMWLNSQLFEASGTIPQAAWSHVAVHYDGERIHFFINGVFDVGRVARLGHVRANPAHKLRIGCDPQAVEGPFAYPFCGHLSDLQIRRGADAGFAVHHLLTGWSFDGDLRDLKTGAIAGTIGTARFAVEHPEMPARRSIQLDGTWCVAAAGNVLSDPGRRLCLRLRLKPDAGQIAPVIIGSRTWKLWLQPDPGGYRPTLTIGRMATSSNALMPAGRWADLIVAIDGDRVVWYVNGVAGGAPVWRLGRIPRDPSGRITIGADASSAGTLISPLRGLIADLEAGDSLPGPTSPMVLVDRAASSWLEHPFPDATAPSAPAAGDFIVRDLEPGTYQTFALGVDVFGRIGGRMSGAAVTLTDVAPPPRPGGARARFLSILGAVTSVVPCADGAPWRITITPSRPASIPADVAATLIRHDLELAEVEPVPAEPLPPAPVPDPPSRQRVVRAEVCEVASAALIVAGLTVELHTSPLPRLRPKSGQRVTIAHDRWIRAEWTWTGTQRLLAAAVDHFQLSERRRLASGTGWTGWAALGPVAGVPVVATDVIEQSPTGAPIVPTLVTHADWQVLRDRGVTSLPEPIRPGEPAGARRPPARIWRMVLPGPALPAAGARLPPQVAGPDDFVAGALVAYNVVGEVAAWQLLPVSWHHWTAAGWALYLVENSKGRTAPTTPTPIFSHARYYPGQRYRFDAMLPTPVDFGTGPDGRPIATVALEIAVASVDTAGRRSAIDPMPGEPRATGSADLVAVDRRRPLPPPRPTVLIERADFHGESRATVTWSADPSANYQVYRATDAAVFLRDSEQRRRRTGLYDGLEPDTIVADDPDFAAWLAACWPGWVADWRTRLFVSRPVVGADSAEWDAASAVWRAWAARFYPTWPATSSHPSDPHTLAALGERIGNEDAFALVNPSPITGGTYLDAVNGAVRNRYLYRLRSQSAALVRSLAWGPVSVPVAAPAMRRPRTPAITRIEAGNRRLVVQWALNDEPELAGYRLYRARTAGELDDLRWWEVAGERRLIHVADPRLRVTGNQLTLPPGLDAIEVIGVFRTEEFGGPALDHVSRDPAAPSEIVVTDGRVVAVRRLRALADAATVVLVYRNAAGDERRLGALADGSAHIDEDLLAGDDHCYRLVAVDGAGQASAGSAVVRGRAFDITPPIPPPLDAAFDDTAGRVRLSWAADPTVSYQVQRFGGGFTWGDRTGWLPAGTGSHDDPGMSAGTYIYRLRAKSRTGVLGPVSSERTLTVPGET